jgi:glutamate-ammonia-ligase adenylyltransferase
MLALLSRVSKPSMGQTAFDLSAFAERERARGDLERITARTSRGFLDALLPLLAESPDPDQSLNLLERLVEKGDEKLLRLLGRNPTLLHYVTLIFGRSYWLGETLLQNTDLLEKLLRDKRLELSLTREDYKDHLARLRAGQNESDITAVLTRFKKREYVRILLRDALGVATLAETTQEISALADAIIQDALEEAQRQMQARYAVRQRRRAQEPFAVLALGKLGGNELNYSSDVDLLYLYGGAAQVEKRSLREYFIRQAQLLTEILSRATPEGTPFRIDLRLRPQGSEGEPAVAVEKAIDYYSRAARDWELQALIKARYCAGDESLARAFIRGVERYVYKETVNFAAIETALHSRERMGARRRRLAAGSKTPATLDVKLDRGGIRDIEFLAQCLQRVYGGDELWLRSGGTLFSLQKLHDKAHLSGKDFQELTQAYQLLRRVEHALQLQRGQQIHHLPRAAVELRTLERAVSGDDGIPGTAAVGVMGRGAGEQPEAFLSGLRLRMARIAEIYERVIHSEQHCQRRREKGVAAETLRVPAATVREMSFAQVMERVAEDCPKLHEVVARAHLSLHARRNLHRFLSSAMTSGERYAALLEHPQAVGRALALFETSEYLTDILVRHPDAVAALDASTFSNGAPVPKDMLPGGKVGDPALALAQLRRDFRKHAFVVGAQDVLMPRGAFASMRELTRLGDAAVRRALKIVNGERSLAVFAMGRLGTEEFDIASDADLLFVRAPEAGEDKARLNAERLVHALSAYTKEGSIFAVDARLRPRGAAGELVVTPAQIEKYMTEEAQAWEGLSYSKLRFVAGREDLAPLVLTQVWHRIVEISARREFPQAVAEMRERLEKANRYPHSFKLARGGFYDIDFIASYLLLREASPAPGNTLDRLQHLLQKGLLDPPVFTALRDAALLYRTADHVIRLVTGRARPELPEAEHARQCVERLANTILEWPEGEGFQERLAVTAERVRSIFLGVVERY